MLAWHSWNGRHKPIAKAFKRSMTRPATRLDTGLHLQRLHGSNCFGVVATNYLASGYAVLIFHETFLCRVIHGFDQATLLDLAAFFMRDRDTS
jgi:hypothetical protein